MQAQNLLSSMSDLVDPVEGTDRFRKDRKTLPPEVDSKAATALPDRFASQLTNPNDGNTDHGLL